MLRRESAAVRLYLERAANARERASVAVDETARQFHRAMESKWMDLAASTAVVERVDCSSKPGNFASVCHRRICVPFVAVGCRLKLSNRALNSKPTPSNVAVVALSI